MMDSIALNQTLMGAKPGKHLSYWFDAVRKPILITEVQNFEQRHRIRLLFMHCHDLRRYVAV